MWSDQKFSRNIFLHAVIIMLIRLSNQHNPLASPRDLVFTSLRRFVCFCFIDSQRNIELETSRHQFADRIHQNKQEFDGEKRSEGKTGRKSSPFQELKREFGDRRFACTDSKCFLTSIFAFILLVILQNPSEQFA